MKVYTSNDFNGHNPVGTAAIVIAENEVEGRMLLEKALDKFGLRLGTGTLCEVDLTRPHVCILNDGDY